MKTVKKLDNLWLDLVPEIKLPILDQAVENGWLKKEFVEDIKQLETDEGKYAVTK